jgi:hypothetical protein
MLIPAPPDALIPRRIGPGNAGALEVGSARFFYCLFRKSAARHQDEPEENGCMQ